MRNIKKKVLPYGFLPSTTAPEYSLLGIRYYFITHSSDNMFLKKLVQKGNSKTITNNKKEK